jgi:hypothetical protein
MDQYNQPMVVPSIPVGGKNTSKPPVWFILVFTVVLLALVAAIVFGFWAYATMKDYKDNSDKKSAAAVTLAKAEQKTQLEAAFAETEKSPLKSYTSPSQFGSVRLVYPKTWSAYVVEQATGSTPVDGYFYNDFVPGINSTIKANYSLRLQIMSGSYSSVVDTYKTQISSGKLKAVPFVPGQVKNAVAGVRLDGQISTDKRGSMVILPLRDKVLKIWTEDESRVSDFNNYVLANLTYSP